MITKLKVFEDEQVTLFTDPDVKKLTEVLYGSTLEWAQDKTRIAQKGVIYVYSDYVKAADGAGGTVDVPGFKVGDGTSYLIDLPFAQGSINEEIRQHIANHQREWTATASGSGFHNCIYRGKNLGTSVTDAQYNAIKSGAFEDLFIGDYWTINSIIYRIAAFDYYLRCGDSALTTHHVVLVPDSSLYSAQMRNTASGTYESGPVANTTAGGYAGSDMYKTNLEKAKNIIKKAFSGHVLQHRLYLINTVSNSGYPVAGAWCDSEVDLMCEQMVYGSSIFSPMGNGSLIPLNYTAEKSQLPLFRYRHDLITIRANYWLRDAVSDTYFALVGNAGNSGYDRASLCLGVRPVFCIS